jgi:hypothetical protein
VITTEFAPDDLAFIVNVRASKPATAKDWRKIFDDLDHGMDEIEARVTDPDTWCFQIRLRVDGFETLRLFELEEGRKYTLTLNDPWDGYSIDLWRSALADPASRQWVERLVARYANTLKRAKEAMRSTESLWEDDDTQFGEPLMFLLAMLDIGFVAQYEKFLELWYVGPPSDILAAIQGIIQRHGKRQETAALRKLLAKIKIQEED